MLPLLPLSLKDADRGGLFEELGRPAPVGRPSRFAIRDAKLEARATRYELQMPGGPKGAPENGVWEVAAISRAPERRVCCLGPFYVKRAAWVVPREGQRAKAWSAGERTKGEPSRPLGEVLTKDEERSARMRNTTWGFLWLLLAGFGVSGGTIGIALAVRLS